MPLTRDEILNADDIQREVVPVPEWGGEVIVRGLTGVERDAWEIAISLENGKPNKNPRNVRAQLVARACVDAEGKKLFRPMDAELLGKKSGKALDRVYEVAAKLSGIRSEDIEELAKNLPEDPSEDSG